MSSPAATSDGRASMSSEPIVKMSQVTVGSSNFLPGPRVKSSRANLFTAHGKIRSYTIVKSQPLGPSATGSETAVGDGSRVRCRKCPGANRIFLDTASCSHIKAVTCGEQGGKCRAGAPLPGELEARRPFLIMGLDVAFWFDADLRRLGSASHLGLDPEVGERDVAEVAGR